MGEDEIELHGAKRGTAMLIACLVEALSETDSFLKDRFLERIAKLYRHVKDDMDGDVRSELELISWTSEYLTGFNRITGQNKPLLED